MPRNINGVYALPPGNPVVPGTLIESTWANPTMSDIANELTQSLPRNGAAPMTGPLMLFRDGALPKEAVTFQQLTASVAGQNSYLPAGAIQAFAMAAIPTGWLEANGSAVSRTTYANLFATIGTTYGAGNGTTTFNLPDLRGEFIRGLDNGRAIDPGRTLGSLQGGANQPHTHGVSISDPGHTHVATQAAHTHGVNDPGHAHDNPAAPGAYDGAGVLQSGNAGGAVYYRATAVSTTGITNANAQPVVTVNTAASGITATTVQEGTESRPRNVAMVYCIKAFGALQTDGLGTMAFQNKEAVQITGGSGEFTTLACATAPVDPTDVVRLVDIGGTMTDINCADTQMIVIDKTDPNIPILRPQVNVPFGMVKLDANAKVPNALIDPTGYNYQGTWDASSGTLPGGTQLDGSMYYIDVAGTLTLYHSDGTQSATLCPIGTRIVYVTDSPTLPVPGWYYEPPPVLAGATAAQIAFVPTGTVAATDVQAAIDEVAAEKAPLVHTHVAANITDLSATTVPFTPTGTVSASNVQAAISELDTEKSPVGHTHVSANITDLNATNTPFTPTGTVSASNVQAAIAELDTEKSPVGHTHVTANITDLSATTVPFTPTGTISATDVQAAIAEVAGEALGVGQTWQDFTGSRTSGTVYTNTTGRPIEVKVKVATTGLGSIELTVDGLLLDAASMSIAGYPLGVGAIIPAGSTYVVTVAAATIQLWAELR